jgi:hypothetical protein
MSPSLYDLDFPLWTDQTAKMLQEGRWQDLDLEHLIEEVEDLGNRHRDAIASQLTRLLMHLLKYQYQPENHSTSWQVSIREARKQIRRLQRKHPSLGSYLTSVFEECYQDAREDAADEMGLSLSTFPETSPFNLQTALNDKFLPNLTP